MSKRTSKRADQLRFSGPDLGELLGQVVDEHGPGAAIAAVNRVRSGGFAGFFCREEFEVVVDGRTTSGQQPQLVADPGDDRHPEVTDTDVDLRSDIAADPADPPDHERRSTVPTDLAGLTDLTNPDEGTDPTEGADPVPVFAGPEPLTSDGTEAGFRALLERRLDEHAPDDLRPAGPRQARSTPDPAVGRPTEEPEDVLVPPAPAVEPAVEQPTAALAVLAADPDRYDEFWLRLRRAQEELDGFLPAPSSFVACIGPLALTTPVVSRLRSAPPFASADVIVLTDRTEIVSEPQWSLVRSGNQLVDHAQKRTDRPTVLVIDVPVELPNWVAPLQNRLRMAGVGLFRYATPGNPTAETLDRYRQASDVPYVLDLLSRVPPEDLVDFMAQRHPIASVGGAPLSAELLVALREQVGVER